MTRRRRPIVSIAGDTRSNGSVSHAGKSSTASAPRYSRRSAASRSASTPVGTASTTGRRAVAVASVAAKSARAGSGTATGRALPGRRGGDDRVGPEQRCEPGEGGKLSHGERAIARDARVRPGFREPADYFSESAVPVADRPL